MKSIPKSAAVKHQARIVAAIADAVTALRAADTKLGYAADEFAAWNDGGTNRCLDLADLWEAQLNARHFAQQLATDAKPALTPRVFAALVSHDNEHSRNCPHIEGAVLALMLAERCLRIALKAAGQFGGGAIEPRYRVVFAARGTVRAYLSGLASSSVGFGEDDALDAILAGKRRLAVAA